MSKLFSVIEYSSFFAVRHKEMYASGKVIVGWFKRYCTHHRVEPPVLESLSSQHTGIGTVEKEEAKTKRLFEEKVEQLALALHEQHGKPPGGHHQFLAKAREQLGQTLHDPLPLAGRTD